MSSRGAGHSAIKLRAGSGGFAIDRFARQQAARATVLDETRWRPYPLCRKLAALTASVEEVGSRLCTLTTDSVTIKDLVSLGEQLRANAREMSECADSAGEQIAQMVSASLASLGSSEITGNGPMLQLPVVMKAQQNPQPQEALPDAPDAASQENRGTAGDAEIQSLEDLFGGAPADVK